MRLGETSYSDVMVVGYIYENALKVLFSQKCHWLLHGLS